MQRTKTLLSKEFQQLGMIVVAGGRSMSDGPEEGVNEVAEIIDRAVKDTIKKLKGLERSDCFLLKIIISSLGNTRTILSPTPVSAIEEDGLDLKPPIIDHKGEPDIGWALGTAAGGSGNDFFDLNWSAKCSKEWRDNWIERNAVVILFPIGQIIHCVTDPVKAARSMMEDERYRLCCALVGKKRPENTEILKQIVARSSCFAETEDSENLTERLFTWLAIPVDSNFYNLVGKDLS